MSVPSFFIPGREPGCRSYSVQYLHILQCRCVVLVSQEVQFILHTMCMSIQNYK